MWSLVRLCRVSNLFFFPTRKQEPPHVPRGDEGPFWTRQLALGPEGRICSELQESLDAFDAKRSLGRKHLVKWNRDLTRPDLTPNGGESKGNGTPYFREILVGGHNY